MKCELCERVVNHAPGCPHEKPVGAPERELYLRGMRDGKAQDVFRPQGPEYVDGYKNGAGLIGPDWVQ